MVVPIEIVKMAAEATSQHNDGWTMKAYRDRLIEIRDYINKVLHLETEVKG